MASKVLVREDDYLIRIKFFDDDFYYDISVSYETALKVLVEGGVEPPSVLRVGDFFNLSTSEGNPLGSFTLLSIRETWRAI